MAALFALAPETGLPRQDNQDAASAGGRWLFAVADGLGGHTAPRSPRCCSPVAATRWFTSVIPARSSPAVVGFAQSLRTGCSATLSRRRLARVGARPAPGRQAGPFDWYGLADLGAGGRWLLVAVGLSLVMDDRPHRNVRTLRAASADALASWPSQRGRASVPRLAPHHWAMPCMRGKPTPGSRSPPKLGACRSAAITGTARGRPHVRRRLPARCA
jgi:hypothetical protein